MSDEEIVIFNGHYDSLIESTRKLCCDNFASEDYGTPDNEFSHHVRGITLNMMRNMPKFDECSYMKHMNRCRQAGYLPAGDENLVVKRHWTWCTIVPLSVFKPKFDKFGKCLCDLCVNEDCVDTVPSRETHPFVTEVPLVAGDPTKKKTRVRKNKKRARKRNRKVPKEGVFREDTRLFVSPSTIKDFIYVDPSVQRTSANSYLVWSMRLNDIYDPDPLVLTGGITGFNEAAAIWSRFHVNTVSIHVEMSAWETSPEQVGIIFSAQSFVGFIGSRAQAENALERYGTKLHIASEKGGMDKIVFNKLVKVDKILGRNIAYDADAAYNGYYNGSPGSFIYVNFIVISASSAINLSNGIMQFARYSYRTNWYNQQPSLMSAIKRANYLEDRQELYRNLPTKYNNVTHLKKLSELDEGFALKLLDKEECNSEKQRCAEMYERLKVV